MNLENIIYKSKEMIQTFVNSIHFDGDWYSQLNTTPLVWGEPKLNGCGEFVSPGSKRLDQILKKNDYDELTKEMINDNGVILINRLYQQQSADSELYITLIHEIFHANRDLLVFDVWREDRNEYAFIHNNRKIEQNTDKLSYKNVDASQEILKGSIDTSKIVVDGYGSKSDEEIEDLLFVDDSIGNQMEKQRKIDESLVEIMARVSYLLYRNKQKGIDIDIWDIIQKIKDDSKDEYYDLRAMDIDYEFAGPDTILAKDRAVMCDILLKHHDFELFNWMLDPILYSQGDIHYDFFKKYTNNDSELLKKLYENRGKIDLEDEYLCDVPDKCGINILDIRDIAISETAIEELLRGFEDIMYSQNELKESKEMVL